MMMKQVLRYVSAAAILFAAIPLQQALAADGKASNQCAAPSAYCAHSQQAMLLPARDTRAGLGGNGGGDGGKGNCWRSCFNAYNSCMDQAPKDICVPQMRSCLAVCDTLSN